MFKKLKKKIEENKENILMVGVIMGVSYVSYKLGRISMAFEVNTVINEELCKQLDIKNRVEVHV